MSRDANINDRETVKAIYRFSDYQRDVGTNSQAEQTRYRGVLIENYPDPEGAFRLRHMNKEVTEERPGTGGLFLCAYMGADYDVFYLLGTSMGAVLERGDIFRNDDEAAYDRFIDRIIKTAKEMPKIQPMDPHRLAGFQ